MHASAIITLTLPSKTCDYCGHTLLGEGVPAKVKITKLHAAGEEWGGSGVAEMTRDYVKCPDCGGIFEALLHAIPVQCADFVCPRCKEAEHLDYTLEGADEKDSGAYQFTAIISCSKCNRKRSMSKLLAEVASITNLSVGQVEISAEQGPE